MPLPPSGPVVAPAHLDAALVRWEQDLLGIAGRDDLLDLDDDSPLLLDLGTSHPSGLAGFLARRETRLSTLFREPSHLSAALRRARAIRVASARLTDDLGLPGSHLATGILTWSPPAGAPVCAPVVLQPLTLAPRGGSDFELVVDGAPQVNPALLRLLAGHPAVPAERLADPAQAASVLAGLPGARIHDRTLLGAFAAVGPGLVADLRARQQALADHPLVHRLLAQEPQVGPLPTPATSARSARAERLDPPSRPCSTPRRRGPTCGWRRHRGRERRRSPRHWSSRPSPRAVRCWWSRRTGPTSTRCASGWTSRSRPRTSAPPSPPAPSCTGTSTRGDAAGSTCCAGWSSSARRPRAGRVRATSSGRGRCARWPRTAPARRRRT